MRFAWDAAKNAVNIAKHGIDFGDVTAMFAHPMLTRLDTRRDYGEDRWIGIGLLRDIIAVVVFTEDDEMIRIISARKARRYEVSEYQKVLAHRLEAAENHGGRRH